MHSYNRNPQQPVSIAALYGETSRLAAYRAGCIEQYLLPQPIDQRVAHWIREAEATAMQLLTGNLAGLKMLAHELLEGSAPINGITSK